MFDDEMFVCLTVFKEHSVFDVLYFSRKKDCGLTKYVVKHVIEESLIIGTGI